MKTISKIFLINSVCFLLSAISHVDIVCAQEKPPVVIPPVVEQQLENLTQANEDAITEDDAYLQEMQHFLKEPLNLNYADEGLLQQIRLLTPLQISNLLSYRKIFGNFIDIYELQAIPGWDIFLIKRILPYITVSEKIILFNSLSSRFHNGDQTLLVRSTQVLEKSAGYLKDSGSHYDGSPQKLLVRYKYKFKNSMQFGFTAEKDAGESFFKNAQKQGFDFYSAHFFIRNLGVIKSLAIGDFSINLGQGLTQWQSLSFGKGAEILNIKRQSDVLRPYNSAGEILFNRGVGITLQKNKWEGTMFASYRKIDANIEMDSVDDEEHISSFNISGYHRTATELENKNAQKQFTLGGNANYSTEKIHVGFNAVHYQFDKAIQKRDLLYNKYALTGKRAGNYSVDYSYTFKNLHFFGEAAVDERLYKAFVNGLAISPQSSVDMSFLYRKISPGYQSLNGNAFTENTYPNNESGFYTGITIRPTNFIRVDAYADFYRFPWLKFRTDGPSTGNDYMFQLTYKPNKEVEIYSRYKVENKAINYNPLEEVMNPLVNKPKQGWRTQMNFKLDKTITLRSRVELNWFDKRGEEAGTGFLTYVDFLYKPLLKPFSGNIRFCYFETDGYNSRMYAFENDVLYSYSIPVFFDKGYRYYLNVNYDISKKLTAWFRFAQTIYADKNVIGSALDEIKGNRKSEVKLQLIYSF
ncbi:MAG: hypothetical protein ABIP35_06295 [Ginsengibacter sp.]